METNSERRRRKLAELCEQRGLVKVAERSGLNWAALDQIIKKTLLPPKKDGSRSAKNLGDDAARKIERAEGLGEGWLDSDAETSAKPSIHQELAQNQTLAPASNAQAAINNIATLEQSLEGLAHFLAGLHESDRAETIRAIAILATEPERHVKTAAGIRASVNAAFAPSSRKTA